MVEPSSASKGVTVSKLANFLLCIIVKSVKSRTWGISVVSNSVFPFPNSHRLKSYDERGLGEYESRSEPE